ncbi:uncharacterized protein LY89DRAFT_782699 [Mollisia scopiformis]|uniref:2EXR domain-containing protein n=1 Tax=Mollisia scopiformis TaxID=149040 RepID=A0A194X9J7_MOLSC|nr:uncharacterized protein LY89DRAFT_782699 [Mollisia scopiformis]KUJ16447.1 hypothetical protein LY89DRAFT_782699 [Mollisia scopiformis]
MAVNSNRELSMSQEGDEDPIKGSWTALHVEIRLMIWRLAYAAQTPRLVEVQTLQHNHYDYPHAWYPRYSPSPPPTIVNVCREARDEARREAQKANHLLFATTPDAFDIYFNPAIDTLYVPNDKTYWIRDWGPEGVLTQFKKHHQPELLRFLAIELDPLSRATTHHTLRTDLKGFTSLEDIVFVVKEPSTEIFGWVEGLSRALRIYGQGIRGRGQRTYPEECKLAIKRGGLLELIHHRRDQ